MSDAGIGRILVAALHQGIADVLPARLEFYESWFSSAGMRHGTIGLAALNAVLSFLRIEGDAYALVTQRAGICAGEWTVQELTRMHRELIRLSPPRLRAHLGLRVIGQLVQSTCTASQVLVRTRRDESLIEIRGSIFCEVREKAARPLCGFYAAAAGEVLARLDVAAQVTAVDCRGRGASACRLRVTPEA